VIHAQLQKISPLDFSEIISVQSFLRCTDISIDIFKLGNRTDLCISAALVMPTVFFLPFFMIDRAAAGGMPSVS
jgi:hypothetical protein